MKVLANDGISQEGKQMLVDAGYYVSTEKYSQDNLAQAINDQGFEVLIVRSATQVDSDLIDSCPGLKMVIRGGVGMDNIDVYYAEASGIKVANTPSSSSQSVAELVLGMMLSLSRGLHDSSRNMPQTGNTEFNTLKKKYSKGIELRGKTLGIVGFGRIGQSLASYALAMGMEVLPMDLVERQTNIILNVAGTEVDVPMIVRTDIEHYIKYCDFVSFHIPKQENGDSPIGEKEIAAMKDGVIVINASRGGVINEDALISALNSGKIAAAGLDVFEDEPRPDERLLTHPSILSTPHIGAATLEAQDRIGIETANLVIQEFGELV